ncbi:hypothetical protein [Trueperella sp. LYQ143]|uniref:hypothetical protein n=1 Tax=unclassified Trueperella TaxID=2630174 RepID=UPI003983B80B
MRNRAIIAAGLCCLLAACSSPQAVPEPRYGDQPQEILTQEQFAAIAEQAAAGIAAATTSNSADQLGGRIAGPMRDERTGQLRLKAILGDSYQLDPIVISKESTPVLSGTGFPRTAMTVEKPADGQNLTSLTVWTQDSPRTNYALWAQVQLFPGVNVPKIVSQLDNEVGDISNPSAYAANPNDVLATYALYNASRTQQAIKFQDGDPLFTQIAAQQDSFGQALGRSGSATTQFAPGDKGIRAVHTDDGGLIIVGELNYVVEITRTQRNAKVRIADQIGALYTGNKDNAVLEIADKAVAHYSTTVAFYIPPAGAASAVVQVIGSAKPTLVAVENVGANPAH